MWQEDELELQGDEISAFIIARTASHLPHSTMAQFTLSYDHRVIDGADGARFMVRLTEILENIERTLMGG